MLKIFLSSIFKDFTNERHAVEAVIHRISAQYVGMEHFGSFADEPIERSLKKVRSSDVLILILGYRYGSVPSESSISFTEAEYREATKSNIPVLCYLPDYKFYQFGPEEADSRHLNFINAVKNNRGVSWFTSPEDIAWKVATDIAREFSSRFSNKELSVEDFTNQVLHYSIKDRITELVDILEERAQRIQNSLNQYFHHAPVQQYLEKFKNLHARHISSLRNGNMILAHELLIQIHQLSFRLSQDELIEGHRQINLSDIFNYYRSSAPTEDEIVNRKFDDLRRGQLICIYVAGKTNTYSKKNSIIERVANLVDYKSRSLKFNPLKSLLIFEKILADI